MRTTSLVSVQLTDFYTITLSLNTLFVIVAALIPLAIVLYRNWHASRKEHWEPVEVEIPFGPGKVRITPNHEVSRIAHEAWTELITRKAGLLFDEQHDLIADVYNSWYELFRELRALIRTIPPHKLHDSEDARNLVTLLVRVLNEGLRPHLTKWQASYRHWYALQLKQREQDAPNEIQKSFPQYDTLLAELKEVNRQIVDFAEELRILAHDK